MTSHAKPTYFPTTKEKQSENPAGSKTGMEKRRLFFRVVKATLSIKLGVGFYLFALKVKPRPVLRSN